MKPPPPPEDYGSWEILGWIFLCLAGLLIIGAVLVHAIR